MTDQIGHAYFPSVKEWRVEAMMIHGAEQFFWSWCVEKAGYETYTKGGLYNHAFSEDMSVILQPGNSVACTNRRNDYPVGISNPNK